MNAKIDAVQARDPGEWVSGRSVSGLNPVSARFGQNPGPFQQAIRNEAPGTAGFLEWGDEFVSLLDSPRLLPYLAFTLDASTGEPPVHRHGTGIRLDRMYGIEMSAGPTAEGGFHQVSVSPLLSGPCREPACAGLPSSFGLGSPLRAFGTGEE